MAPFEEATNGLVGAGQRLFGRLCRETIADRQTVPRTVTTLNGTWCELVRKREGREGQIRARIYEAMSLSTTPEQRRTPQLLTGGL
jgi:hypothetical protein